CLAVALACSVAFAACVCSVLVLSVLGVGRGGSQAAARAATAYLDRSLPFLPVEDIAGARGTIAVVSAVALVFAGVAWIDSMRSAQRAMWQLEQSPGNFVIRWLVDFAILVGLGLLLAVSLFLSSRIQAEAPSFASGVVGLILAQLINFVMSAGLLVGVPRLWVSTSRVSVAVVLVG